MCADLSVSCVEGWVCFCRTPHCCQLEFQSFLSPNVDPPLQLYLVGPCFEVLPQSSVKSLLDLFIDGRALQAI